MAKLLILALALTACAPTYRIATRHPAGSPKCPPTMTMLEGDFSLTVVLLAMSALAYNAGNFTRSGVEVGAAMGLALADNISEGSCRR